MNLVGTTLGKYQIVAEIGRGGMAIVYKAYQAGLERYVALKVLPPELTFDQEFVHRFQQEARTAGRLDHSNIVTVYDVGEENGIYYIAMKYVEGQPLHRLIPAGRPLGLEQTVSIVAQIASALDYAHQQGIIHRDIKPSNILVDAQGQAFLTDFGIAKAAEGTRITRTGMLMGTPEYMSPEQAQGQTLDWRTDIYSLGVVVYEMLTGQAPFTGDTARLLYSHAHVPPPPLHTLNPKIPSGVEAVVTQSLAKNPADRPQQAGQFAQKLAAAARGEPVALPQVDKTPATLLAVPRPGSRLNRRLVGGAIGGVALLGILIGVLVSGVVPITPSSRPSVTPTSPAIGLLQPTATSTPVPPTATLQPTFTSTSLPTATLIPTAIPTRTATPTAAPTPAPSPTLPPLPTATSTPPPPPPVTGRIVYTHFERQANRHDIYIVNADGSGKQKLTNYGLAPSILPTCDQMLYKSTKPDELGIMWMDLRSGAKKRFTKNLEDTMPVWSNDGTRIAFASNRDVSRQWGIYVKPAAEGGETTRLTLGQDPFWHPAGLIVFKGIYDQGGITTVQPWDKARRTLIQKGNDAAPSWSPDGGRILFVADVESDNRWEIWVMDAGGGGAKRLSDNVSNDRMPAWMQDGQHIVYRSNRGGSWGLWIMATDGSNATRLLDAPSDDNRWGEERITTCR